MDGHRLQTLPLSAWRPMNVASTFHSQDVNFDGYLDVAVPAEFGAKWVNESWWVVDPASGVVQCGFGDCLGLNSTSV